MKKTLLDMVQSILSDMTSDPVNSISDTVESMQVARIVRDTFENLVTDRVWPSTKKLIQIVPSGDGDKPTHMSLQDEVSEVLSVKYFVPNPVTGDLTSRTIVWKDQEQFLLDVMSRNTTMSNVQTVIDYGGTPLFVFNDQSPSFYTSFDDKNLVFDSYDSSLDSTLQASKTQVYGIVEPQFLLEDDFVPDMPSKYFPYLINEAKSTAMIKIKEVFSQKDEQNASRQKSWLSRTKNRIDGKMKYPDYGRKAGGGTGRYARRAGYRDNSFTG